MLFGLEIANEGVVMLVNLIRVLNCLVAQGIATAETNLVDQDLARIDALQKEKSGFADNLMYVRIGINAKTLMLY